MSKRGASYPDFYFAELAKVQLKTRLRMRSFWLRRKSLLTRYNRLLGGVRVPADCRVATGQGIVGRLMKQFLKGLKNLPGWRTREKLVIFSVDDYGNVRVDSAQARQRMIEAGLKLDNQFDRSDALETREDLEALFETLSSVRDVQGLPACFTPYSVCANPDFVRMRDDHSAYKYEPLIQTFKRLASSQPAAYEGAWALWQEGMAEGLLRPQYHGREHLNLEFIERKLAARDPILMTALANDSLTGLEPEPSLPSVGFTAGFAVHDGNESELEQHREILADGLRLFEETFGFASKTFTPPAMQINPRLYPELESLGVAGYRQGAALCASIGREDHRS